LRKSVFSLSSTSGGEGRGEEAPLEKRKDWEDLRLAIMANPVFLEKIRQVCRAHIADPRAQRNHFWMHYAEEHLAA
jgi:hypothetical protein